MTVPNGALPSGALMFARYAYPPNSLGFCGPADSTEFREYAAAGVVDAGLVRLAQAFAGAWPYLQLIAAGCGIADPLDRRVVEAYWVGSRLLDTIPLARIADSMEERFRHRVGRDFGWLADGVLAGGVPHHSFAVFCVYPWVGLLGDDRKAPHALTVLDRCRIRWGRVTSLDGDLAVVLSRPLQWDGRYLSLGEPRPETVSVALQGVGHTRPLVVGDRVSLHWDWVCERLSDGQARALRAYTMRHLDLVNHRVERSGPAVALAR
jgi:hypothetical protein